MKISTAEDLCAEVSRKKASIIAVDGNPGVGKSTIATAISKYFGYICVHLDDYLDVGKGRFVANLNILRLENAVLKGGRPIIIEGLCLLEVLEKLGIQPDLVIYVKGMYAKCNKLDSMLFDEVEAYLSDYLPQQKADIIFNMNEYNKSSTVELDIAYIKAKTIISVVLAI